MSMFYILFSIAFLISLSINFYLWFNKPDVSFENAKKHLKEYLVRMMLFYHENYTGSEQLEFIAKWIENIKHKLKDVPEFEMKMFKEIINKL